MRLPAATPHRQVAPRRRGLCVVAAVVRPLHWLDLTQPLGLAHSSDDPGQSVLRDKGPPHPPLHSRGPSRARHVVRLERAQELEAQLPPVDHARLVTGEQHEAAPHALAAAQHREAALGRRRSQFQHRVLACVDDGDRHEALAVPGPQPQSRCEPPVRGYRDTRAPQHSDATARTLEARSTPPWRRWPPRGVPRPTRRGCHLQRHCTATGTAPRTPAR